jgi:hypothetical protein
LIFEQLVLISVILITITATWMLLSKDWRMNIGLLGIQYLCLFILVATVWPFLQAASILFSGWIACTVLGMANLSLPEEQQRISMRETVNPLFNFLASMIVFLLVFTFTPRISTWIPNSGFLLSWAALILIGLGLLRLALDPSPLSTTIGLLTILSGFEILFISLTSSQLSTGLLAGITLFIALAGAYLLIAPFMEEPA